MYGISIIFLFRLVIARETESMVLAFTQLQTILVAKQKFTVPDLVVACGKWIWMAMLSIHINLKVHFQYHPPSRSNTTRNRFVKQQLKTIKSYNHLQHRRHSHQVMLAHQIHSTLQSCSTL